jgi:hypothetical protein
MKGGENRKIRKWGPFVNSAPGSPRSRHAPKTPQPLGTRHAQLGLPSSRDIMEGSLV